MRNKKDYSENHIKYRYEYIPYLEKSTKMDLQNILSLNDYYLITSVNF